MNRFTTIILTAFYFFSFGLWSVSPAQAQDSLYANDGIRFGVTGMGVYNRHNAQFMNLPGIEAKKLNDRSVFAQQEGNGYGFAAGGFVEIPLLRWLSFGLRGNYVQHGATLLSGLDSVGVGRLDGTFPAGSFQREFRVSLASMGAEALFTISPFKNCNLYGGVRAEWAVAKTYELVESLITPSDGVFVDSQERSRNPQGGTLPEVRNYGVANMNAELIGGIGYEFSLQPSDSWTLEPTVFYARQLQSVVQNLAAGEFWNVQALRAGVSLRYYPERAARFDAQAFKVKQLAALEKQIMQERTKIQAELKELRQAGVLVKLSSPVGILNTGVVVEQPTVQVEEFRSQNILPLLPHVFFNEESSVFPSRYQRITVNERNAYSLQKLVSLAPLEQYYHILNVIGKRLLENPAARVTLTGYQTGTKEENNPRNYARQRAEMVSDYLQDVWKIQSNRITTREISAPTTLTTPEQQADYRRVDISSDQPNLLQPLGLEQVHRTVTPEALRYSIDISAGAGLKQWNLEISQFEGNEVKTIKSSEGTSEYPKEYIWHIGSQTSTIPSVTGTIESRLEVTDINNRNADAPIQSTPVTVVTLADKIAKKTPDTRVDIVNLVAPAGKMLTEAEVLPLIKLLMKPNSTVQVEAWVEGSDTALDTNAADERAKIVAAMISTLGIPVKVKSSAPAAAWIKPLHVDHTNPEGRLYNRAVKVEIRTPL